MPAMLQLGTYRHRVTVETPHAVTPDGHGGYTETWAPADPPLWDCALLPATARALERLAAGTSLAAATHIVRGRYHPQLSTSSRLRLDDGRILLLMSVSNREERDRETIAVAAEVLTPTPAPAGVR